MPGVEVVEDEAFAECVALAYVECGKLEIIGLGALLPWLQIFEEHEPLPLPLPCSIEDCTNEFIRQEGTIKSSMGRSKKEHYVASLNVYKFVSFPLT